MLVSTQSPLTFDLMGKTIDKLLDAYPFISESTIGASRLGKPIQALTIGTGPRAVMYNAAHHANEWITSTVLLKFLEECACAYADSMHFTKRAPFWAEEITLHCIPMVNPDGVDLVTGGMEPSRLIYRAAKALAEEHSLPFPECWKANILGVDLNSNYPAGWDKAREYKFSKGFTRPGPKDFVGQDSLCEPETCAMAAYTKINDFELTVSLHTQGEEIYWKYRDLDPPGAEEIAKRFAEVSGYTCQDVPSESAHAGYRDWFIETFNRPGFTIECGLGENPLPLSQFDNMYKKVSPLLWEGIMY